MTVSTSNVEICNLALTKIGEEPITALTEDSKAGRLCNLHFNRTRNMTLRAHNWNFAIKRSDLAKSTTTPEFKFTAQFALPDDLIRLLDTNLVNDQDYKVEGKFILCSSDTLKIKYVAEMLDPSYFDELFIEALSCKLAAELAIPLADNVSLAEFMYQQYAAKLRTARSIDATEGYPDYLEASTWLDSRASYNSPFPSEN
tara:strand:- start:851 stop:1450 length:600 start_codon:yes stop_codon:yes gene_type:complete